MKFIELSQKDQRDILERVSQEKGIRQREVVEKDWWVTAVLRALFCLPYAEHLSFKGGTSLSKCWHLISRFSEDIDIAIDREYLGFCGSLSKTQISDKLRRTACSFVREQMQYDLARQLERDGIASDAFKVHVNITPISTTDPEVIDVNYQSAVADILTVAVESTAGQYILPKVKIEVSGRSMSEPVKEVAINSMIDQVYPNAPFCEPEFQVRAVLPERTFLEKVFLLHEEFAKPIEQVRVDRMSRHMYDIVQMMPLVADKALADMSLYRNVVEHRRTFIGLRGFDYNTLMPDTLSILPPNAVVNRWREDYGKMRLHMIYGEAPSFDIVLATLQTLNAKIRQI